MAEIDRVKQTLSFGQLRNAAQYNIGDRRKRKGQNPGDDTSGEPMDEPKDTVELADETLEMPQDETPPRPVFGGETHLDLSA